MMPSFQVVASYDVFRALSKNNRRRARAGHSYFPKLSLECIALLSGLFSEALGGQEFARGPVTVRIVVYRPDVLADPHNVVDALCDCLEGVIGVNDRWYSVSTTWHMDRESPRMEVIVSQDDFDFPMTYCVQHADFVSSDAFYSDKTTVCKDCHRERAREDRKLNPEKHRERDRARR